jgi:predicted Fe-Mo cluster-binding NifX family protein
MKVALTVWEDTVSTVCDFSSRLLVFDVIGHEVKNKSFVPFKNDHFPSKVNQLEALGVDVLLCGAISRPLERMICSSGVKVIPWLRGFIEEVIAAYLVDGLSDDRFILPGFVQRVGCPRGGRRDRLVAYRSPTAVKGNMRKGRGDASLF